jgi:hypothetical protein
MLQLFCISLPEYGQWIWAETCCRSDYKLKMSIVQQFDIDILCEYNIFARTMCNINKSNVSSVSEWFSVFIAVQYRI